MSKEPNVGLRKAIIAGSGMTGYLLSGGLIGRYFSQKYDNKWLFIIGLSMGVILGLYELFKFIKK
tara:strand:- start:509 stop:703 length:195 start_codon:yes stop_codon:yes gene_type:complete